MISYLPVTVGKEVEGRTVTDRLKRLLILYSEDIFSSIKIEIAKSVPNQIKQKRKPVIASCKVLRGQGIRTLEMLKTL